LPCPAAPVPGREGPERRRRPRPDGTRPDPAGPRWVRMAPGTAGRGWARAVTTGKSKSQLGAPSQPEARLMTFRAGGFEPLTQELPRASGPCQQGSCRPRRASPIGRACASTIRCEARSCSPAVPSPCHSEHDATGSPRSTTDTHGPLTCGRPTTGARQHEWSGCGHSAGPAP
jgi:hypothetical protein